MRSIEMINSEIASIKLSLSDTKDKKQTEITALRERLEILKEIKLYLSTNPTEEAVRKQLEDVLQRIKNRDNIYIPPANQENMTLRQIQKDRTAFNKEWGVPKLKLQRDMLAYLLEIPALN